MGYIIELMFLMHSRCRRWIQSRLSIHPLLTEKRRKQGVSLWSGIVLDSVRPINQESGPYAECAFALPLRLESVWEAASTFLCTQKARGNRKPMSGQSLFIPASTTLLCTYRTHIVTYIHIQYIVHTLLYTVYLVVLICFVHTFSGVPLLNTTADCRLQ